MEIIKQLVPSPKLRWEELDEVPYLIDSMMALEILFHDTPLEIAKGGVLSSEVSFGPLHLLIFYRFWQN